MKPNVKVLLLSAFLLTASFSAFSQNPPHPNDGNNPTGTNTPVGGGASVGDGVFILLALVVGYGGRRLYQLRMARLSETK